MSFEATVFGGFESFLEQAEVETLVSQNFNDIPKVNSASIF